MARAASWMGWAVLALASTALATGCDPTSYTDVNFGSSLGADFVAPVTDAGSPIDDAVAPTAGAGGAAGDAGGLAGAGS
jgi:hypothetical protein